MAQTFAASVRDWANRSKEAMDDVLRSSVEDVLAVASASQESARTRGGPAQQGLLPFDTGFLRNSVASDLNGSGEFATVEPPKEGGSGADGRDQVVLQIAEMGAGDYLHIAWTAAYARRINSGFSGEDSMGRTYNQPGVHFVERAAENWPEIVAQNAEYLKP